VAHVGDRHDLGLGSAGLPGAWVNPKLLGTVTTPKVLIYVDDGHIDVMHTRGVEVAVIVEGEDVEIPDDWRGLMGRQHHSLPITVNRAELPQKRALQCDSTSLAAPNTQVHHSTARNGGMKAPYCYDCDGNHPVSIGCDGLPKTCSCCGASYGQLHSTGCADQNPLAEGGNIVQ